MLHWSNHEAALMNLDIHDALNFMMAASDLSELRQIFERLICKLGFDLFALQFTPNSYKTMDINPIAIANYEKKWVDHYFEQAYHLLDPVITVGSKKNKPFLWSETWQGLELNKKQQVLFHEAEEYGVSSGIGIPVLSPYHTNGMVTLVSSLIDSQKELKQIAREHAAEIQLLCVYFQQMSHYFLVRDKIMIHSINLDANEIECLKWAYKGKTNYEIGIIMNKSHSTIAWYFANCRRKLNAVNKEQSVAKALILGLIDVNTI